MTRRRRADLTPEERAAIRALARERHPIDKRLMDIGTEIQKLMDERDALKRARRSNKSFAEQFCCSETTILYAIRGRV